ncbi:MAG TPA: sulfotransferase domain-containing protein [Iamia sp.]|nr:sulfotransferase domain-containing protein [Iamia sp.]
MDVANRLRHLRNTAAPLVDSVPVAGPALQRTWARRRFSTERALLKGADPTASDHPSILHFSLNKAATQHVRRLLTRGTAAAGLVPVHLNGYAFWSDLPYADHGAVVDPAVAGAFHPEGYLYSSFGGFVGGLPDLERYRKILVVRDPRDILVSQYFSIATSHQTPGTAKRAEFLQRREHAREVGIDAFVLERAPVVQSVLRRYADELLPVPGTLVTTYEELVTDLGAWLRRALAFVDLPADEALVADLVAEGRPAPEREDVTAKRRQVTPGDHRRKLRAETIAALDEQLAEELVVYGYAAP